MLSTSTHPTTDARPGTRHVTPDGPAPRMFLGVLVGLALSATFFWAPLIWALTR